MNTQTAITTSNETRLTSTRAMTEGGQAANEQAARHVFDNALAGKAHNTERRKKADLFLFETFLNGAGIPAHGMYNIPEAWQGVTWGLLEAFKEWQLSKGYAIGSINGRLSTVRNHAGLAAKAGAISDTEARMIESVKGYTRKEARHVDEKRKANGVQTRMDGAKKEKNVVIPDDIAEKLIVYPDTPQGRRDTLLMCLLLEHGLRVGEVASLTAKCFDTNANTFTFFREKVDKTQTHTMSAHTRDAAKAYLKNDAPANGSLWRKSHKGTHALSSPLSSISATRALTKRVELLGRHAGLEGLSAHDCRHYWATFEARSDTRIDRLRQAGGWTSVGMAMRYIEDAEIANEGTARIKGAIKYPASI